MPELQSEIEELHNEAKYYLIQGLVDQCQKVLKKKQDEYFPVCRIPVITSQREAQLLISSSSKVSLYTHKIISVIIIVGGLMFQGANSRPVCFIFERARAPRHFLLGK